MHYLVVAVPDPHEHGYTVTVPALPGGITEGATLDEAFANVRDAITEYLDGESSESLRAAGVRPGAIVAEIEVAIPT
ncbi:MAG TPA: type II toxin-antitoxin system HicB family antitoxin [Thermomicrobiales bacterium]